MNKKAQGYAGAIITAFLVLFMVIILWNVFTPAVNQVLDAIEPMTTNQDALDVMSKLRLSWENWPLIMVIAIIVFVIVRGITHEQYTY